MGGRKPLPKELVMDFLSPGHLIVIGVVALVVLVGWKKLPEMSRSVGRSLRIFKTEMKAMDTDVRDAVTPATTPVVDPQPAPAATTSPTIQVVPQPADTAR
jgi:sec-independent protein translocase protein TatA